MVTLGSSSRGGDRPTERPSFLPRAGGVVLYAVLHRNWVARGGRTPLCQGFVWNKLPTTHIQMCLSECPTTCISEQDKPPQPSIHPSYVHPAIIKGCVLNGQSWLPGVECVYLGLVHAWAWEFQLFPQLRILGKVPLLQTVTTTISRYCLMNGYESMVPIIIILHYIATECATYSMTICAIVNKLICDGHSVQERNCDEYKYEMG